MKASRLETNFIFNLVGPLARMAIALVTIPIYVRHVGEARYGVIAIAWVLLGYFGFLDLGLSRAATNALARLHDAPQRDRARVVLTTLALTVGFGAVGWAALFFAGGFLLERLISAPESLRPEIVRSLPWIASLLPMAFVTGVGIGALESRERFLVANLLQVAQMSMTQIAPVVAAVALSPSLTVVIPAAAIAQAGGAVLTLAVTYRHEGPFHLRDFDFRQARGLLRYGGWISVSSVLAAILTSIDQFVIGSLMGVAAVTRYSVPMSLVVRSQVFPAALARTFFPRMSSAGAAQAHALGGRALATLSYGYAGVCAPAIIVSPVFFRYWMGADFALTAAPVAQILFVGAWINGLAFIAFTLMQGQGRPDLTGKLHLVEILPFLALLWALVTTLGINGAAIAWTLRVSFDALAMFWAAGIAKRDLVAALRPAPLLLLCGGASRAAGSNPGAVVLLALAAMSLSLALAYVYSEDWRGLVRRILVRPV